jgi:thiol-disulfide isomerase/thioredoxin
MSTALGGAARAEPGLLDLSAYKGKVVYLDFWASWCGPCKQSFPYMMSLQRKYGADGLAVIAVNLDKDRSKAQAFLKETGSTLPIVYDANGVLPTKYKIRDMPSAILIGKDGRVRFTHKGFFEGKETVYEAHISELINEE